MFVFSFGQWWRHRRRRTSSNKNINRSTEMMSPTTYLQSGWALHSSAKWWQPGVWWAGLASFVPTDTPPAGPAGGGKWYRSGRLAQSGCSFSWASKHSSFLFWLFLCVNLQSKHGTQHSPTPNYICRQPKQNTRDEPLGAVRSPVALQPDGSVGTDQQQLKSDPIIC